MVEEDREQRIHPRAVASASGLMPTESRIAAALPSGSRVRDIAVAAGNQEGTIRWHVKRIFRKHGVYLRASPVRLVLSL